MTEPASQCPHLFIFKVVKKFGKMYLELHYSENDRLVFDRQDERYFGMYGERIFEMLLRSYSLIIKQVY